MLWSRKRSPRNTWIQPSWPSAEREDAMPASPRSPHCTCASDSMTSLITGCPRGSLFSSFTYVTWYPRICPCCLLEMGSFQLTRMAVEFTDSTSTFRGGALGTVTHTGRTVSRYHTTAVSYLSLLCYLPSTSLQGQPCWHKFPVPAQEIILPFSSMTISPTLSQHSIIFAILSRKQSDCDTQEHP